MLEAIYAAAWRARSARLAHTAGTRMAQLGSVLCTECGYWHSFILYLDWLELLSHCQET